MVKMAISDDDSSVSVEVHCFNVFIANTPGPTRATDGEPHIALGGSDSCVVVA